jgi:hypothetical protein
MAVTPLFSTREALLAKIRMSATTDADTLAAIDTGISQTRIAFFNKLGLTRTLQIQAFTENENPITEEEGLRLLAATTEVYWVLYFLIPTMPAMLVENQYALKNTFDDQPITRDAQSLSKYLTFLKSTIDKNLGILALPEVKGAGSGNVASTGAAVPYLIGDNAIGNVF